MSHNVSSLPWVEKYRPIYMKDILGNNSTVSRLEAMANHGSIPHILLCGPPGCGKTTSLLCIARHLASISVSGEGNQHKEKETETESLKQWVLELNASDDRGIDVVRETIKNFAMRTVDKKYPHKIVILDEADSMTAGAQHALRRTMENYSSSTRFALACNTSNKIIDAIQSRCAIVRFGKLSDVDIAQKIIEVAQLEGITIPDEGLASIVFCAEGDMRCALNNLQSAVSAFGRVVTKEHVLRVCDHPQPLVIREGILKALDGKYIEAMKTFNDMMSDGYLVEDLLGAFSRVVASFPDDDLVVTEDVKIELLKEVAVTQYKASRTGLYTRLQLAGMVSSFSCIHSVLKNRKMG